MDDRADRQLSRITAAWSGLSASDRDLVLDLVERLAGTPADDRGWPSTSLRDAAKDADLED